MLVEEKESSVPSQNKPPDCSADRCTHVDFFTSKAWTATPGNHMLKVIADSKNDIAEGNVNELNNTFSKTLNVSLPPIKPPVDININPAIPRAK
jgi:hypothetical protein